MLWHLIFIIQQNGFRSGINFLPTTCGHDNIEGAFGDDQGAREGQQHCYKCLSPSGNQMPNLKCMIFFFYLFMLRDLYLYFSSIVWRTSLGALFCLSFLRDEHLRSEWDILSNGGLMQEIVRIAKSREHGNCLSSLGMKPIVLLLIKPRTSSWSLQKKKKVTPSSISLNF